MPVASTGPETMSILKAFEKKLYKTFIRFYDVPILKSLGHIFGPEKYSARII